MDLNEFYKTYGEDKVKEALQILNYKKTSEMPKTESDSEPTLYIFRHGQSEDNAEYLFSGWRDPKLTPKGIEQAKDLAEKLKSKKIDMLVSSTQTRAIQTMKIAVSLNKEVLNKDILTDYRIRERCYGVLQGQSKLKMQLENPNLLKEYRRSYTKKAKDGESLEDVVNRVSEFCEEIVTLMKKQRINVAVSCHGNSIRGFRKYFEKLSEQEVCEMETPLAQDYLAYVVK